MRVRHYCYHLTDWNGITPRQADYNAAKVVKVVKGKSLNGWFNASVGGQTLRVDEANKQNFLDLLWKRIGTILSEHPGSQYALVAIPSSAGTVDAQEPHRTLQYARAIAAASNGKVAAVDALRWREGHAAAHSQAGMRFPETRYDNLVVTNCPQQPIILFDDVITSGSSFIAAAWRLEAAGNAPEEGFVIARRTVCQEPKMFGIEERELEIPSRPMI